MALNACITQENNHDDISFLFFPEKYQCGYPGGGQRAVLRILTILSKLARDFDPQSYINTTQSVENHGGHQLQT